MVLDRRPRSRTLEKEHNEKINPPPTRGVEHPLRVFAWLFGQLFRKFPENFRTMLPKVHPSCMHTINYRLVPDKQGQVTRSVQ